jgi:hypothetical protein
MEPIDVIQSKLKVLSSLPPYTKLNTSNSEFTVSPDTTTGWFKRICVGGGRKRTCDCLHNLYTQLESLKDIRALKSDISGALVGIGRLVELYSEDEWYRSRLQVILEKFERLYVGLLSAAEAEQFNRSTIEAKPVRLKNN